MAEDGHAEALAARLKEAVAHLQGGRPDAACPHLEAVCTDNALAAADDLRDVRARALSLWADALLQLGRADAADAPLQQAMDLLRRLGDREGLDQVRALRKRLLHAREAQAANERSRRSAEALRGWSLDDLRQQFASKPLALADALIKKANAEADDRAAGDPDVGRAAAHEALALATEHQAMREWVFAHISLARLEPERARDHLVAAWQRAERASEFNLVSAIARAAEAGGVALPVQVGPDLTRQTPVLQGENDDPNHGMG